MHTRLRRHTLQRGFTLIEILTVLAIIGILTAILVPAVSKAVQRSRVTAAAAEIRSLKTIVAEAANRLNGFLPITEGFRRNPGHLMNTSSMRVFPNYDIDPLPPLNPAQTAQFNANNLQRGINYSKLLRLDHLLTTLTPPLMDGPWVTRFGGAAVPGRMIQPPIRFDARNIVFRSTAAALTIYTVDGANSADDSSLYSRIETAVIVAANVFDITNPLADVNTAGGICFDLDGNGVANQLGRQCAYIIYKSLPVTQAYNLAKELNSAGLMTDTAPGGTASQTRGTVIYGPPVGGVVDVYVHLLTL